MLKRLPLFLWFAMLQLTALAQTSYVDSVMQDQEILSTDDEEEYLPTAEEETYDTILKVYPLEISADTLAYWKNKKEFQYIRNLDSLLEASQKKEKAKNKESSNAGGLSLLGKIFNSALLKTLLWMMAVLFVLIVLYQLLKNRGLFAQSRAKQVEEVVEVADENILEQDFDSLIQSARSGEDYRLATRYQFLKVLQALREKEWIEFSLDKTNNMYAREVPVRWRQEFASLILSYEYVWYGKFHLTLSQYELLQKKYTTFHEKL